MTSHVPVGAHAPDFSLSPAPGAPPVTLSELRGRPVVLLFFPLAFSRVCTEEMCEVLPPFDEIRSVVTNL